AELEHEPAVVSCHRCNGGLAGKAPIVERTRGLPALLGVDVHADPDAIARVVVGAGHVGPAGVLGGHGEQVGGAAGVRAPRSVLLVRAADGHAAVRRAVRVVVHLAAGHGTDGRADRGGRIARGAAADLAADHRADHAAEHRSHGAPAFAAAARLAIDVVAIAAAVVVAGVVAAGAGRITVGASGGIATRRTDHRDHAQYARVVVVAIVAETVAVKRLHGGVDPRVVRQRLRGLGQGLAARDREGEDQQGRGGLLHGVTPAPPGRTGEPASSGHAD